MKNTSNSESSLEGDSIVNTHEIQEKSGNLVQISLGRNIKNKQIENKEIDWNDFKEALANPSSSKVLYNNRKRKKDTDKIDYASDGNVIELQHKEAIEQIISYEKKNNLPYFVGGYFEPEERNNKNLKFRSLIVLDIDKYPESITQLESKLNEELSDYDYFAYSTISYNPESPSIRVVIRSEKIIDTKEYPSIVGNFIETLSFKDAIDKQASTTASQAMFLPLIIEIFQQPEEEEEYKYQFWWKENSEVHGGKAFDQTKFVNTESSKDLTIIPIAIINAVP